MNEIQNFSSELNEYKHTVTDSTIFIRPIFGSYNSFYSDSFYNTYINTTESAYFVYNLTENSNITQTKKHNENVVYLKTHTQFKSDFQNDIFHIINLSIPDNYMKDYYTFLDSKFSKFSSDMRYRLRTFYSNNSAILKNLNEILCATDHRKRQLAEKLGVDVALINEVGEVRSRISFNKELFYQKDFEEKGTVYNYVKAERDRKDYEKEHGVNLA